MTHYTFPGIFFETKAQILKCKWLTTKAIEKEIAHIFSTTAEALRTSSKSRKKELVKVRQTVMYLAKKYTFQTLAAIGKHYRKDHATTLHACNVITNLIETKDKDFFPLIIQADHTIKTLINEYKLNHQINDTPNAERQTSNAKPQTPSIRHRAIPQRFNPHFNRHQLQNPQPRPTQRLPIPTIRHDLKRIAM
jgi:hypothetical protein